MKQTDLLAIAFVKTAAVQPEPGLRTQLGDAFRRLLEGKHLQDMAEQNRDRVPAAEDVLNGTSMTLPHSALRVGLGGLAGAGAGQLLGTMFSSPITEDMPTGESDAIRARRRRISRIGAVLGALGTANHEFSPDLGGAMNQARQKMAL